MQRGRRRTGGRVINTDVHPGAYSRSICAKIHGSAVYCTRQEQFGACTITRLNWTTVHLFILSIAKDMLNDMLDSPKLWDDKKLSHAYYEKHPCEIHGEFSIL